MAGNAATAPFERPRGWPGLAHWHLQVNGRPTFARIAVGPPRSTLPIVLVHGLGVSSRYMVPLAKALASDHDVYAPDLPGFGHTFKPHQALTIRQLAAALAAWMDVAGVGRAVLIGNSLGCQVIVEFAQRWPERVAKTVLVSPTMDAQARTALRQCWRLAQDAPREPFFECVIAAGDYLRSGLRRNWQTLRDALSDPVLAKLPQVVAATLVVRGGRDPIVSQAWAEEVTQRLPNGRLVVLPGAPHAMNYSRPVPLARAIMPFLAER